MNILLILIIILTISSLLFILYKSITSKTIPNINLEINNNNNRSIKNSFNTTIDNSINYSASSNGNNTYYSNLVEISIFVIPIVLTIILAIFKTNLNTINLIIIIFFNLYLFVLGIYLYKYDNNTSSIIALILSIILIYTFIFFWFYPIKFPSNYHLFLSDSITIPHILNDSNLRMFIFFKLVSVLFLGSTSIIELYNLFFKKRSLTYYLSLKLTLIPLIFFVTSGFAYHYLSSTP